MSWLTSFTGLETAWQGQSSRSRSEMADSVLESSVRRSQNRAIAADEARAVAASRDGMMELRKQDDEPSSTRVSLSQKRNQPPLKLHLRSRSQRQAKHKAPVRRSSNVTPYPQPRRGRQSCTPVESSPGKAEDFASQLLKVAGEVAELGRRRIDAIAHRTRSAGGQEDWVQGRIDGIITHLQALAGRHYEDVAEAFANGRRANRSEQGLK